MRTHIEVSITERDIRLGRRQSPDACALARAIHRAGYRKAQVGDTVWYPRGGILSAPLPVAAIRWTRDFDHGPSKWRPAVRPVTFRLRLPKAMQS